MRWAGITSCDACRGTRCKGLAGCQACWPFRSPHRSHGTGEYGGRLGRGDVVSVRTVDTYTRHACAPASLDPASSGRDTDRPGRGQGRWPAWCGCSNPTNRSGDACRPRRSGDPVSGTLTRILHMPIRWTASEALALVAPCLRAIFARPCRPGIRDWCSALVCSCHSTRQSNTDSCAPLRLPVTGGGKSLIRTLRIGMSGRPAAPRRGIEASNTRQGGAGCLPRSSSCKTLTRKRHTVASRRFAWIFQGIAGSRSAGRSGCSRYISHMLPYRNYTTACA